MESKTGQFVDVIADMLKKQHISSLGDQIYFHDIPPKKLANARKALGISDDEEVLILFDDTLLGSAKDGMAVTTWGARYKVDGKWAVSWEDLYANALYVDTSAKEPVLLAFNKMTNKYDNRNSLKFYFAKTDNTKLIAILQAGRLIFGNKNKTDINTFEHLAALHQAEIDKITRAARPENTAAAAETKEEKVGEEEEESVTFSELEESAAFAFNLNEGIKCYESEKYGAAAVYFKVAIGKYNAKIHTPDQLANAYLLYATTRYMHFEAKIDEYVDDDKITDQKAFFDLIDDTKKAIAHNPTQAVLYYMLGIYFSSLTFEKTDVKRQEYFNEALRYYDKAIELASDDEDYKKSRQELIDENRDCYESQPVDMKIHKLSARINIVCDTKDKNFGAAETLGKLIKQSNTAETALLSKAEYDAAVFESDLLGEEPDFYAVFIGDAAVSSVSDIAWKFNERGIKYGWKGKKAALYIENKKYSGDENTENKILIARYQSASLQEAMAKVFYNEGITQFLNEGA